MRGLGSHQRVEVNDMASQRQIRAAKRNVKKAQAAAKSKRTIAHLPKSTRRGLQAEARKCARRGGKAGHALEDRNREQLYEIAKKRSIRGRSKMGKWELIDAIRGNRQSARRHRREDEVEARSVRVSATWAEVHGERSLVAPRLPIELADVHAVRAKPGREVELGRENG